MLALIQRLRLHLPAPCGPVERGCHIFPKGIRAFIYNSSIHAGPCWSWSCIGCVYLFSVSCQIQSVEEAESKQEAFILQWELTRCPPLICLFCNRTRSTSCMRGSSMEILTQTATSRKRRNLETQGMQLSQRMHPNQHTYVVFLTHDTSRRNIHIVFFSFS